MPEIGVSLRPAGGSVVVGQARDHTVTIDRPKEKEGTDAGPMGGELLLLALGGCFVSTFLAALKAEAPEADASEISFQVDGTLVSAPTPLLRDHRAGVGAGRHPGPDLQATAQGRAGLHRPQLDP
ncbi:hypothetical protein RFN58_22965 [Streptomyces iakyrus]|uniref:hypothetical protein n=1 Tax=Streptomyces iakyrus TaxID=68219 RepID=UPI001AE036CB|nr:hypothetical protein [Streptomyces iakyrus]